ETLPHITGALAEVMEDGETWDGELYIHGVPFQKITSWVKRAEADSLRVQYDVYDAIAEGSFADRYHRGLVSLTAGESGHDCHRGVDARLIGTHDQIRELHDEYVQQGYEGAMVRHNGCPYKEGYRSRDLLKVKAFEECDFEVVGVSEGKGKFEG